MRHQTEIGKRNGRETDECWVKCMERLADVENSKDRMTIASELMFDHIEMLAKTFTFVRMHLKMDESEEIALKMQLLNSVKNDLDKGLEISRRVRETVDEVTRVILKQGR